ncbi:hypothetical protein BDF19DRAFT_225888 [Syncephalis fuscata]|nr:hypothetical protein BDF19DRAFT_225888 [Syncephalis fuscata]
MASATLSVSGIHDTAPVADILKAKVAEWSNVEDIPIEDVLGTQPTTDNENKILSKDEPSARPLFTEQYNVANTTKVDTYSVEWPNKLCAKSLPKTPPVAATVTTTIVDDNDAVLLRIPELGRWSTASSSAPSFITEDSYWSKYVNRPQWWAHSSVYNKASRHQPCTNGILPVTQLATQQCDTLCHFVMEQPLKLFTVPSHHDSDQRWRGGRGRPRRHYTIHFRPGRKPLRRVMVQRSVTWTKREVAQMHQPTTNNDVKNKHSLDAGAQELSANDKICKRSPTLPIIKPLLPAKVRHHRNSIDLATPVARWPSENVLMRWNDELEKQQLHNNNDSIDATNEKDTDLLDTPSIVSIDSGRHGEFTEAELATERTRIRRELMRIHRFNHTGSCTSSRTDFTGFYSLPASLQESQLNELLPGPVTHARTTQTWHTSSAHLGMWLFLAGFVCPIFWIVGATYVPWPRTERIGADYEWRHRNRIFSVLTVGATILFLIAMAFIKM